MSLQGEHHPATVHVLPVLTVTETICECGADGPRVITLGWLVWSLHFFFDSDFTKRQRKEAACL